MNKMVCEMVNLLFQDVAETEETKALHDEIMQNCQEHFQDLVDSGMTEDEAASAVMESLSGMQEVVDQYPKKEATGEIPVSEPESVLQPKAEETSETDETESEGLWFPAEAIGQIRVDAGSHDVQVNVISGNRVRVYCAQSEGIRAEIRENTLVVEAVRVTDSVKETAQETARENAQQGVRLMDMSLNELLSKVKNVVEKSIRTVAEKVNEGTLLFDDELIEISVPESLAAALVINASSGDLQVAQGRAPEITLRTASGDVELRCSAKEKMDRLFVSSASGDIQIRSAYAVRCEASAISGDVNVDGDFGELFCKSVSGDVEVDGTAVDVQGKSVSGDVQIRLLQAPSGRVSAESTSGDTTMILPEDCGAVGLSIATMAGEVNCALPDAGADAPLQLRARTVSGDIRIEKA